MLKAIREFVLAQHESDAKKALENRLREVGQKSSLKNDG